MKAITTRYVPQTKRFPARIRAFDSDRNSCSIPFPMDAETDAEAHRRAAAALCEQMHWDGAETLKGGAIKNGYAFVFCD